MRCARAVLGALVAVLLAATSAAGEPAAVDEQTRAKARAIGEEGLALYDQGLYIDALDRFDRASELVKAPTLDLMAARCLAKMGRLVAASERYLDVTRMTVDAAASNVLKEAVIAAGKEREAVLARIATIEIVVEGPGAGGATVKIDGRPVPKAVIGVKTPIDPGIHRIEAQGSSGTEAFGRVNIQEKQPVRLVLTLHPAEKVAPPAPQAGGGPRTPAPGKVGLSLGGDAKKGDASAASKRGVDEDTRAAARVIGEEGLKFYDSGDYFNALDRFERADALIHAPTLGLMEARCLVQLRRLVEASDRYQDVSQAQLDAKASDTFKDAVVTAAKERAALLPRLPIVDVSVEGPDAARVTELKIDGRTVSPQLLGVMRPISAKLPLDPGDHRLEASLGSRQAYERISLPEGGTAKVVLQLGTIVDKLEPGHPAPQTAAPKDEPEAWTVSPERQRRRTAQLVAGSVVLGLGVAGVVTGAVAGGLAIGRKNTLDGECDVATHTCPPELRGDVHGYNSLRHASTIGFVLGGVGVAAGAVILVTAPRASTGAKTQGGLTLTPFIGAGSAGVRGAF